MTAARQGAVLRTALAPTSDNSAMIFAVLAGGQLFGFIGILLALPAAAVLAVVMRHAHEQYIESELYRT